MNTYVGASRSSTSQSTAPPGGVTQSSSLVGGGTGTPQWSTTAVGSPQAPVACAFVSRRGRSAIAAGSRTVTAAQAGDAASSAGSSATIGLQAASGSAAANAIAIAIAIARLRRAARRRGRFIGSRLRCRNVEVSWAPRHGERTLAELGEDAALAGALPRLPASDRRLLGPGDDAAVIAAPDGRFVVTGDTMIEGPDFRLAWTTPGDFGWKLVASNLADVAAMGARPTALTVSIALPGDAGESVLADIAEGMAQAIAALAPGCGIEGGDLARSPHVVGAATAFGDLEGRPPVLRSGARPGDVLAVSGEIGLAAHGLDLLFRLAVDDGRPDRGALDRLRAVARPSEAAAIAAQLRPRPPIADGVLAALGGATAMLDVSDGLVRDARRIGLASGVSIQLDGALVRAAAVGADASLERLLAGGEDHALLAAFPPGTRLPGGFTPVGEVGSGAGVLLDGVPTDALGGWDPFRS